MDGVNLSLSLSDSMRCPKLCLSTAVPSCLCNVQVESSTCSILAGPKHDISHAANCKDHYFTIYYYRQSNTQWSSSPTACVSQTVHRQRWRGWAGLAKRPCSMRTKSELHQSPELTDAHWQLIVGLKSQITRPANPMVICAKLCALGRGSPGLRMEIFPDLLTALC